MSHTSIITLGEIIAVFRTIPILTCSIILPLRVFFYKMTCNTVTQLSEHCNLTVAEGDSVAVATSGTNINSF